MTDRPTEDGDTPLCDSLFDRYYPRSSALSLLGDLKDSRVLDVGCGPGLYAEDLVNKGARVVGVDVNPLMVDSAEHRLGRRAEFHVADASKPLDFLDTESFDVVLASLVMHYLSDWSPTLDEISRVLRPSGRLYVSVHHPFVDLVESNSNDYWTTEEWVYFDATGIREAFWRRPLESMLNSVNAAGFRIDLVSEPKIDVKTPDPALAKLPRLLIVLGTKTAAHIGE